MLCQCRYFGHILVIANDDGRSHPCAKFIFASLQLKEDLKGNELGYRLELSFFGVFEVNLFAG